jgi:hypothetical protein
MCVVVSSHDGNYSVNYFLFIRPNTSPLLQDFWNGGYPRRAAIAATIDFFAKTLPGNGYPFLLSSSIRVQRRFANHGLVAA